MKHTKGEWKAEESVFEPSDRIVMNGEGVFIAKMVDGSGDMRRANAKLIAAAPDLLEALKTLLPIFEDWHQTESENYIGSDINMVHPEWLEAIILSKEAIKKAIE